MKTISAEDTVYHLALGSGTVKKISDKFISVEFHNQKLKYRKEDVDHLIFTSKNQMYSHFSKTFKILYYTAEAIYNKSITQHKLSLEYYKIFDLIVENEYKRYYRFIFESLEGLKGYFFIHSNCDSGKIKKIIEFYLSNKYYSYALHLSISYKQGFLLKKSCKKYISEYENDLDKILHLFKFCLKTIFKFDCDCKNQNKILCDAQYYDEEIYGIILNLILNLDEEVYLLIKLEEPLFDRLVQQISENLSKKSFQNILKYYCKYHECGNYAILLDNLIKYSYSYPEEKQYLNRFIDSETKKVYKCPHVVISPITIQLKEQLPIILRERGITELFHFTHINNVSSIISSGGLWPRSVHKELGIIAQYSDQMRLDNTINATSLSISFPNYMMLYQKQKNYGSNYAILVFDSSLLYLENEKVLFCYKNAASTEGKFISGCDIKSFNTLFDAEFRNDTLPEKYPTNSQAEILIEGIIDIKYIKEIHVNSIIAKEKLYCVIDDAELKNKIQVNSFYFNYGSGKNIWKPENFQILDCNNKLNSSEE